MATATGLRDHRLGFVSQTNEIADQGLEVSRPLPAWLEGDSEDDGVLLSVTLDINRTSFLPVLDARDLSELARVDAPQHIPWHFHGLFAENAHDGARRRWR